MKESSWDTDTTDFQNAEWLLELTYYVAAFVASWKNSTSETEKVAV